jgi:DNA modification methylase
MCDEIVGLAAVKLGRRFVGIAESYGFHEFAESRIREFIAKQ